MRSFRGIDDLTLDFDPKVTVPISALIGNNSVGKTYYSSLKAKIKEQS